MIVKSFWKNEVEVKDFSLEEAVDIEFDVHLTVAEVAKIRHHKTYLLSKVADFSDELVKDLVLGYIQIGYNRLNFCQIQDTIKILYYLNSFSIDEARNLNILLRDGVKITHQYFGADEWMILSGISVEFEDVVETNIEEYFRYRVGESFRNHYRLYEEPDKIFCVELIKGSQYLYHLLVIKNDDMDINPDVYYKFLQDAAFTDI